MNAVESVDLEDTEALVAADRDGLLRAASMSGAYVRAVAAARDEGALESLYGERPRTVVWVAGRGVAHDAGAMLAATLGPVASQPFVIADSAPPWLGPLDVVIIAGDDAGDPALIHAAGMGVRRGARVVVATPFEGPLRDSAAGRVAVLSPRLPVPDEFGLCQHLAAGLAVVQTVDPRVAVDLAAMADQLDHEALRNSAGRELFTNPAKMLAERLSVPGLVLAGDGAATLALARYGSALLLRVARQVVGAAGLADVVVAVRSAAASGHHGRSLFHDDDIDGPIPERLRALALILDGERNSVSARTAGLDDVSLLAAADVPELSDAGVAPTGSAPERPTTGPEPELAVLAVRLQMAAVYLRLVRG